MTDDQNSDSARNTAGNAEAAGGGNINVTTQAQGKADQLAGKAQETYGAAKEAVSSTAKEASSTISGMARRAGSQASELSEQVYAQGTQAAKYVGGQIKEEPIIAMLAAVGLGVLIGYLIGRAPHERAVELGRFRASYRDR